MAAKRRGLGEAGAALFIKPMTSAEAVAAANGAPMPAAPAQRDRRVSEVPTITTTVRIRREQSDLLTEAAIGRRRAQGGKADASAVLRHVLDLPAVLAELEKLAKGGAK